MKSRPRPLSPHLQIYRPQWTSILSITHRATGVFLSAGLLLLTWWVVALASGPDSFKFVQNLFGSIIGQIILFGFTLSLFYHLGNGIRHLVWDSGYGLDLSAAYWSGIAVLVFTIIATTTSWVLAYAML